MHYAIQSINTLQHCVRVHVILTLLYYCTVLLCNTYSRRSDKQTTKTVSYNLFIWVCYVNCVCQHPGSLRGTYTRDRPVLELSVLGCRRLRLPYIFVRYAKRMPPKKKDEGARKPLPLIGRFGTSLKCGIVGLPNVGYVVTLLFRSSFLYAFFCYSKSTFFNVLTKSGAPAENFPFCTIDPNENKCNLTFCYKFAYVFVFCLYFY